MKRVISTAVLVGMVFVVLFGTAYADKPKVLYIDSYHAGYEWSDGVTRGILETLNVTMDQDGKLDNSASPVELKIVRMDTQRNTAEEFRKEAALKVKDVIASWKPDIAIASDDNASKYVIVPYFKDADLPFVFCAVNWTVAEYGYPFSNVTGMVEVSLIPLMLDLLKNYAAGDRIGYLGADNITNHKEVANVENTFHLQVDARYVNSFEDWKTAYKELQEEVDIVYMGVFSGLEGWNEQEAAQFVEANTKIPSGCSNAWIMPVSLVGYSKVPEEQGEYAAQTALQILAGKSPADFPIVMNKRAQIYLNMKLAEKLGIKFPLQLVKRATLIQ